RLITANTTIYDEMPLNVQKLVVNYLLDSIGDSILSNQLATSVLESLSSVLALSPISEIANQQGLYRAVNRLSNFLISTKFTDETSTILHSEKIKLTLQIISSHLVESVKTDHIVLNDDVLSDVQKFIYNTIDIYVSRYQISPHQWVKTNHNSSSEMVSL